MAAPKYESYRKMLADMEVGHSFFVEGKQPKDLYFLRQVARRAGFKISIHRVENDEIYQGQAGVRVWKEKQDSEDDKL
jgi:hypothetical protein